MWVIGLRKDGEHSWKTVRGRGDRIARKTVRGRGDRNVLEKVGRGIRGGVMRESMQGFRE